MGELRATLVKRQAERDELLKKAKIAVVVQVASDTANKLMNGTMDKILATIGVWPPVVDMDETEGMEHIIKMVHENVVDNLSAHWWELDPADRSTISEDVQVKMKRRLLELKNTLTFGSPLDD